MRCWWKVRSKDAMLVEIRNVDAILGKDVNEDMGNYMGEDVGDNSPFFLFTKQWQLKTTYKD